MLSSISYWPALPGSPLTTANLAPAGRNGGAGPQVSLAFCACAGVAVSTSAIAAMTRRMRDDMTTSVVRELTAMSGQARESEATRAGRKNCLSRPSPPGGTLAPRSEIRTLDVHLHAGTHEPSRAHPPATCHRDRRRELPVL